jgi:hypothetical protein
MRSYYLPLLAFLVAACSAAQATPDMQFATFQPYLGRSLSYLARQGDETGLLREAPGNGPARHWLLPDNTLALWAFDIARAGEAATKLRSALEVYEPMQDGPIEAMQGTVVAWPPHTTVQTEVQPEVWTETHSGESVIAGWENYSDLRFAAALNAWNAKQAEEAQRIYSEALQQFDGKGFPSKAAAGRYATRDLALAIFTGARIGARVDRTLIDALLDQQAPSGGFYTHYTADGPEGDTDTATTAYAALALMTVRQE